jgi:hypothetical protein
MIERVLAALALFAATAVAQDSKARPTAEDRKPFESDPHLCRVYKPSGKELEWDFKTDRLPADGVVRVEHKNIMNLFVLVRCQRPLPNQKLTVSDDSVQRYADSVLKNPNLQKQKELKRGKTVVAGEECWTLEFEYERAKSPDVFELRVWIFLAKANGYAYTIEAYSPNGVYDKLKAQVTAIVSRLSVKPKAP